MRYLARAQIEQLEDRAFAHLIARAIHISAQLLGTKPADSMTTFEVPDMSKLLDCDDAIRGFLERWECVVAQETSQSDYVDEHDLYVRVVGSFDSGKLTTTIHIYEETDLNDE